MAENVLRVTVNGIDYAGWKTMDVSRSMVAVTGSFSLEMVDLKHGNPVPLIRAGDKCMITIQPTPAEKPILIMTGYVDMVRSKVAETGVTFSISGRDITCDIVDCSVTQASEWKKIKFEDFVEDVIRPFPDIEVVLDSAVDTGPEIESINYDQGTKVYELIAKHAQLKQLILYTLPNGKLLITRASKERLMDVFGTSQAPAFIVGDNCLEMEAVTDWSEVFSEYEVKGQRQSTGDDATEEEATQIQGITNDTRMNRFRPLIIIPDGEQSNVSAKNRSEWEATFRIADAEGYTVLRQGWQAEINKLALLRSTEIGVDGDYLMVSYRVIADEQGKRTNFAFAHPRVFAPLEADEVIADDKDTTLADVEGLNQGGISIAGGTATI
jgi:prophage tail gpP-like protein